MERFCGGEAAVPARDIRFADADVDLRSMKAFGDLKVEGDEPVAVLDAESGVQIGEVGNTDVADGVPILAESLGFAGREEGEVRLIIGVGPGHELDIGAVV